MVLILLKGEITDCAPTLLLVMEVILEEALISLIPPLQGEVRMAATTAPIPRLATDEPVEEEEVELVEETLQSHKLLVEEEEEEVMYSHRWILKLATEIYLFRR